jgi:flavin reductase ActVB
MTVDFQAAITQPMPVDQFTDVMSRLVSGLAVLTVRDGGGLPCGLLVSSLASYSTRPPSVLVSVARTSHSWQWLVEGASFGAHLLSRNDESSARTFADHNADKFRDVRWTWDDDVPRLLGGQVYLRCSVAATFHHGDHTVVIGEVIGGRVTELDPLVYYGRRFDWRLQRP